MALRESDLRVEIPKHIRQYIENELRMYKTYLAEIHLKEEELGELYGLVNQKPEAGGSGGNVGHPTESMALRIVTLETEIKQKLSRVKRIDSGLETFPPGSLGRKVIEARYFSGIELSHDQIMQTVWIGNRNKYFGILREVQYHFGTIFGVI